MASAVAGFQDGLLLPCAHHLRGRHRASLAHARRALRLYPARLARFTAARRCDRHRCAPHAMDGLRRGRSIRWHSRIAIRLLEGLHLPGSARRAAVGGRTGDGAARWRTDAHRPGLGRSALHVARGRALARFELLARGDRRRRAIARTRLPARHRRHLQTMTTLVVRALSKSYGGVQALRGVSFSVASGEVVALIGPNGAGKTTCFNLLNGQLSPDAGSVELDGQPLAGRAPRDIWRLGVGRTFQITATFGSMTARENVQMALGSYQRRLASPFSAFRELAIAAADALLQRVGMHEQADKTCAELAYGDLKRM